MANKYPVKGLSKMQKYRNTAVTTQDGQKFDSQKEFERWCELRLLERAGKITDLQRQVKYVLIPTQRDEDGKLLEKECAYWADFAYIETETGKAVVEDVKGYRDPSSAGYAKFIIKRKLMLHLFDIRVKEV